MKTDIQHQIKLMEQITWLGFAASFGMLFIFDVILAGLCFALMSLIQVLIRRGSITVGVHILCLGGWLLSSWMHVIYSAEYGYLITFVMIGALLNMDGIFRYSFPTIITIMVVDVIQETGNYQFSPVSNDAAYHLFMLTLTVILLWLVMRFQQGILRQQQRTLQQVLDTQTEMFRRYKPDTTLTYVNPAYARMFGKTPNQMIGTRFIDYLPENERQNITRYIKDVMENRIGTIEHSIIANGQTRWQRWYTQVLSNNDDIELQGFGHDITDHRLMLNELKHNEAQYRAIVEDLTDLVCRFTPDGRLTFVNQAYCDYFSLQREELLGYTFTPFIPDEDRTMVIQSIRSLNRQNPSGSHEHRVILTNGETRWIQWTNRIILIYGNEPLEFQSIGRDITIRKNAELALKENELRLRGTFVNNNDAIFFIDLAGIIFDCNPRTSRLLGYSYDELIGKNLGEMVYNLEDVNTTRTMDALTKGKSLPIYERVFIHKDGTIIPTDVNTTMVFDDNNNPKHIQVIIRDITERKEAEKTISDQINQLRTLMANIPNGAIIMFDKDMRYLEMDGAALRNAGRNPQDLIGKTIYEVMTDESLNEVLPIYEAVLAGENLTVEKFLSGRYYILSAHPIYDEEKTEVVAAVMITHDITQRKAAEEAVEYLNNELTMYARQLESAVQELESFSYSVSHDLRAPLRGIQGFSQALLEDYLDQLDEDAQDYLNRIDRAAMRMSNLIDDMLTLSRISRLEMRPKAVDLSQLAKEVTELFTQQPTTRQVGVHIQENIRAMCDAGLMRIVLQNLLENAWKFTRDVPVAKIEFGCQDESVYYVRDNGVGFNEAYANKLFGAFQRLHADYEGTGIGLATVRRIINRHGGEIWAESKPGEGATFYFRLEKNG